MGSKRTLRGRAIAGRIDLPTLLAVAALAFVSTNVVHELVGHCGAAAVLGGGCSFVSTSDIRLTPETPLDRFTLLAAAGTAANLILGATALALMRFAGANESRFLLWLTGAANLFLGSGYMAASPLIGFGDWHNILIIADAGLAWRIAIAGAGTVLWLACWTASRRSLQRLLEQDAEPAATARRLLWPSHAAGSALLLAAALLGPLPLFYALIVGLGSGGLTAPLLAVPFAMKRDGQATGRPFILERRAVWVVLGAITILFVLFALGPGFDLVRRGAEVELPGGG